MFSLLKEGCVAGREGGALGGTDTGNLYFLVSQLEIGSMAMSFLVRLQMHSYRLSMATISTTTKNNCPTIKISVMNVPTENEPLQ